jgi:EAL and modified HD-GYP domain-containing signal transduction protein
VNAHSLFTTGLLSMLDVLMGQPLETLLAALPLDESILNAILRGEGVLGQILQTVLSYENCDWSELTRGSANPHQLRSAYFESVEQVKQAWTASA